jgi:anti-anti-sigma factor
MDPDWRNANACMVCGNQADLETLLWHDAGSCPHCDDRPPFLQKTVDGAVVITFLPEMSWRNEAICRDGLAAAIRQRVCLVLNLSCLTVPSSLLLGLLISTRRKVQAAGGVLRLYGLCPSAVEVFQAMQLHRLFDVYPDEVRAIQAPCPKEAGTCSASNR